MRHGQDKKRMSKAKRKENGNEEKHLCSDDGTKRMEIFKQKFGKQSYTCSNQAVKKYVVFSI